MMATMNSLLVMIGVVSEPAIAWDVPLDMGVVAGVVAHPFPDRMRPVERVKPDFPKLSVLAHVERYECGVALLVDDDGVPSEVVLTDCAVPVGNRCEEAALQWRFTARPASDEGGWRRFNLKFIFQTSEPAAPAVEAEELDYWAGLHIDVNSRSMNGACELVVGPSGPGEQVEIRTSNLGECMVLPHEDDGLQAVLNALGARSCSVEFEARYGEALDLTVDTGCRRRARKAVEYAVGRATWLTEGHDAQAYSIRFEGPE